MPSIYQLKPAFQNLLRPSVRALARAGISANTVTVLTLLMSAGMGAWIWFSNASRESLIGLVIFLYFRMGLNAIDGLLAREHNMKTKLGGLLNEVTDVAEDGLLYLPLVLITGISAPLVVSLVMLGAITELTGVTSLALGGTRRYDGPMGKSDRAFVFGLAALLTALNLAPPVWLNRLLALAIALALFTIFNRGRRALQEKP